MLPEPPTPGGVILDDVVRFVRRFVVLSDHQVDTLALWIAHTHAIEAADTTPYIWITSALKRSGKSRLLEVLELLVRAPEPTMNATVAALYRTIEKLTPTLLFDEVDAIFGPKARDNEDLRGILNGGFRRGSVVRRCGGPRMDKLEAFSVFCPKALAGIGKALPDTITDRSVRIRLERRTREEQVERFRRRELEAEAQELRDRIAEWLELQTDHLRGTRPHLPDELDDRAQDIWEPLFALAELAGGTWIERSRASAAALSGDQEREDDSLAAILLRDVYAVFENGAGDRLRTADLIDHLAEIEESPWGDWHGKKISAQSLSRLLQPFLIKTMTVKVDGEAVRGYKREQFADAFHRVLGVTGVTAVTSGFTSDAEGNAGNASNAPPTTGDLLDRLLPPPSTNGISTPHPGDDNFLEYVAAVHRAGQITTDEALEREAVHALILRARPPREKGIPF